MGHQFKPGNNWGKKGQAVRSEKRIAKRMGTDPRAATSKVPLEREFGYCGGLTEQENIKNTWEHGDMPLYHTLKRLGSA